MLTNFKHFKTKTIFESKIWMYLQTFYFVSSKSPNKSTEKKSLYHPKLASTWSWRWKNWGHLMKFRNWRLTPISLNKINLTPLNCCSFPFTVIRTWNNNPVTCFHLSKIGVSSEQFRSFFTDFYIVTIVLHMVHASLFNRGNTFKRFIHSQTMNYPRY